MITGRHTQLILFLFLFFANPLFSQNRYDFQQAEKETRRLVYKHPDSALAIIKKTLSQPHMHDTVYGNTYNLYGIYYGMTGKPDSVIYYTKKSLDYLDEYPKNKVRSLMNLSLGYRNKGEYKTAINYLQEALKVHKQLKNNVGIAIAYGELASNYNYMLDYDTSIKYLLKAIDIFKAENDKDHLAVVKQKLANTYLAKNNFDFAIDLYKECLVEFKASGMDKNYYLTLVNLAEAYIHIKKYPEAEKALAEAAAGLKQFGDLEIIGVCFSKLGSINTIKKNYRQALNYYKQAFSSTEAANSIRSVRIGGEYIEVLNENKQYSEALNVINRINTLNVYDRANVEDQMVYNNAIAHTYKATGKNIMAISAFEKSILLKDSIAEVQKQSALQEIQAKFQTQLQREKNLSLEENNLTLKKAMQTEKRLLWVYGLAALAVICIVLLLLRGYWLRNKLQQQELRSVEKDKYVIEQKRLFEQELINKQLEVIEEKKRELTSSALVKSKFQDSLTRIILNCENGIYKNFNDVKRELETITKQNDYWKHFETRFNNLHPDFAAELANTYPNLTKNDIEFCSLLKLKLTNKEIASLLQISHESVITKKYRIKKKMGLHDDTEFDSVIFKLG